MCYGLLRANTGRSCYVLGDSSGDKERPWTGYAVLEKNEERGDSRLSSASWRRKWCRSSVFFSFTCRIGEVRSE